MMTHNWSPTAASMRARGLALVLVVVSMVDVGLEFNILDIVVG